MDLSKKRKEERMITNLYLTDVLENYFRNEEEYLKQIDSDLKPNKKNSVSMDLVHVLLQVFSEKTFETTAWLECLLKNASPRFKLFDIELVHTCPNCLKKTHGVVNIKTNLDDIHLTKNGSIDFDAIHLFKETEEKIFINIQFDDSESSTCDCYEKGTHFWEDETKMKENLRMFMVFSDEDVEYIKSEKPKRLKL